jgi:hypothetical protein
MTMKLQRTILTRATRVVFAVLCLLAVTARAQYRDWIGEEERVNSRWIPKMKYILIDTDAERDTFDSNVSGHQEVTRYYASPRVAVGWDNYIYHPYLLTYSALFEPGYTWRRTTVGGIPNDSNEFTVNGKVNAELLSPKPYATSLTFDRGHDEVQYGFFNLASVDSQSWGVASGWRTGRLPVRFSFHEAREDADELFQRNLSTQRVLDLSGQNERRNHNLTFFNYQYSEYERTTETSGFGGAIHSLSSDSSSHRVDMQDTEHFERSILRTTMRFAARESNKTSANDLNGTANYDWDLTDRLHNYYQGTYSQFSGDGFDSKNIYASAGLRHQLYESLTSTLDVHGGWATSGNGTDSSDSMNGGVTVSEDYSKRLGTWGRLSLSDSAGVNFNSQSSSSGILLIANESHVVPANSIVRLSRTRAVSLQSVTSSNIVLVAGQDYTVIYSEPWQIQFNQFGPNHIQPGAVVEVTYRIDNPTANTTSFSDAVQVRLSFLNEMASFYARYSFTDNRSSSPNIIVENENMFQTGANFAWKRLVLNADYTDERSTFFALKSFTVTESYSADLTDNSTLGINMNQQWAENESLGGPVDTRLKQSSTFYNLMVSYDWRPTQRLSLKNEIGYQRQSGFNMDQNLLAARSYLNWMIGKIQLSTGYEHENVDYLRQTKLRDYVFFKLRRNF